MFPVLHQRRIYVSAVSVPMISAKTAKAETIAHPKSLFYFPVLAEEGITLGNEEEETPLRVVVAGVLPVDRVPALLSVSALSIFFASCWDLVPQSLPRQGKTCKFLQSDDKYHQPE